MICSVLLESTGLKIIEGIFAFILASAVLIGLINFIFNLTDKTQKRSKSQEASLQQPDMIRLNTLVAVKQDIANEDKDEALAKINQLLKLLPADEQLLKIRQQLKVDIKQEEIRVVGLIAIQSYKEAFEKGNYSEAKFWVDNALQIFPNNPKIITAKAIIEAKINEENKYTDLPF